jgi:hypothetical protein
MWDPGKDVTDLLILEIDAIREPLLKRFQQERGRLAAQHAAKGSYHSTGFLGEVEKAAAELISRFGDGFVETVPNRVGSIYRGVVPLEAYGWMREQSW